MIYFSIILKHLILNFVKLGFLESASDFLRVKWSYFEYLYQKIAMKGNTWTAFSTGVS